MNMRILFFVLVFTLARGPVLCAEPDMDPNLRRVAIFGTTDDRKELWSVPDIIRKLAGSTVAVFTKIKESYPNQLASASSSGALVGDDLVLMSGHALWPYKAMGEPQQKTCGDLLFVFGYYEYSYMNFPADDIYSCKKVLAQRAQDADNNFLCSSGRCEYYAVDGYGPDYAVIQLDRPVRNRTALAIGRTDVKGGEKIFTIGYPDGGPVKITDNCSVMSIANGYFTTELDAFHGNSGGPVFDAETLKVVGIAVRGQRDDYVDGKPRKADRDDPYTHVTLSSEFERWIPSAKKETGGASGNNLSPAVFHPQRPPAAYPENGI
ncbi:MAG: serine protease [Elusimicrobiales bacterium]|jgi:hypothetical protein